MKAITTMGTKTAFGGSYLNRHSNRSTKVVWVKTVNYTKIYNAVAVARTYARKQAGLFAAKAANGLKLFWTNDIMGNFSHITPEQTDAAEEAALQSKWLKAELWIFVGLSIAALAETFYLAFN